MFIGVKEAVYLSYLSILYFWREQSLYQKRFKKLNWLIRNQTIQSYNLVLAFLRILILKSSKINTYTNCLNNNLNWNVCMYITFPFKNPVRLICIIFGSRWLVSSNWFIAYSITTSSSNPKISIRRSVIHGFNTSNLTWRN